MRLLFVTPYLPSPPQSGGPRRLHGLLSGLSRSHSVSVLSLVEPDSAQADAVRATGEYCEEVVTIENDRYGLAERQKRLLQLRSAALPFSYERLVYHRPRLQTALDRMVRARQYDVVTVEFAQMAYYRLPRTSCLVLDEHNIEFDVLRRTAVESTGARKLYSYLNFLKLRYEEQHSWRRFDGCALTSSRDERLLRSSYPAARTAVVPNGVDTQYFCPGDRESESMTLIFFGAIDYYPNTEGLLFFLREVMPRLRQRIPSLRLLVVGKSPPPVITREAGDGVVVTGLVEDVRPYIERASVVIAPIRIGGGTRLKILEAMAMGKPIVSTSIGAEGIDVCDGRDILLADTAETFAAQVERLLADRGLSRGIGEAARELAMDRYDWRASVARLERFYGELLNSPARSRTAAAAPPARDGSWKWTRPGSGVRRPSQVPADDL